MLVPPVDRVHIRVKRLHLFGERLVGHEVEGLLPPARQHCLQVRIADGGFTRSSRTFERKDTGDTFFNEVRSSFLSTQHRRVPIAREKPRDIEMFHVGSPCSASKIKLFSLFRAHQGKYTLPKQQGSPRRTLA